MKVTKMKTTLALTSAFLSLAFASACSSGGEPTPTIAASPTAPVGTPVPTAASRPSVTPQATAVPSGSATPVPGGQPTQTPVAGSPTPTPEPSLVPELTQSLDSVIGLSLDLESPSTLTVAEGLEIGDLSMPNQMVGAGGLNLDYSYTGITPALATPAVTIPSIPTIPTIPTIPSGSFGPSTPTP